MNRNQQMQGLPPVDGSQPWVKEKSTPADGVGMGGQRYPTVSPRQTPSWVNPRKQGVQPT